MPRFRALHRQYEALLLTAKFERQLLANQTFAQMMAVANDAPDATCDKAAVVRSDFDGAAATAAARQAVTTFLDR